MATNSTQIETVKKILIPKYFENIIIPQMEGYYSEYYPNFEARPVAKCPLHSEDTPSLRWYEETNTFYCFGCRKGGDVVQLHRQFTLMINGKEPTFDEAVNFLDNYFLKNMEDVLATNTQVNEVVQKSSVAEAILFTNYIKKLEWQLSREESLGLDKKMIIYLAIDTLTQLVALNYINAKDAMYDLKDTVKVALR